jgi:hypothetical protein
LTIADIDRTEQGAITMPLVRNEPLEILAAWLCGWYERLASLRTRSGSLPVWARMAWRARAHHQVRFHRRLAQRLQQADAVARAVHAGHGDDQALAPRPGGGRRMVPEGSSHHPS